MSVTIRSSARAPISGLMDICRQEHILTDRTRVETREPNRSRRVAQHARPAPCQRGCDEDKELVDRIRVQERGRECRASFEEKRLHPFLAEAPQLLLERTR